MKKNKCAVWILRLAGLGILAALAVYTAWNTGILSSIGQEDIYWERARFILGQGGATNYNGSSLCSLGYSLLLVPICAVLKSPYAAYKAAVLLNGGFLCLAYLVSLRTAKKLFPKENSVFLWAACLLAALCPALAASRSFTGPETLLVLLTWCCVSLLLSIRERYTRGKLAALAACVILGCFLQIAWLGAAAGVVILLGLFVKQKKVEETSFLYFCLAILLGLAAGNIAERAFLASFARELEVTAKSSLELFLDGLMAGWENNYVLGIFRGLCGKLLALFAGSFLLLCPGLWYGVKRVFAKNLPQGEGRWAFPGFESFLIFVTELFLVILYDNSRSTAVALTSVNYIETVLPPMLLLGAVQIRRSVCWVKELSGYLLTLCLCALVTANLYQTQGIGSISSANNGILFLFQDWNMNPVAVVYASACLVILMAILACFCAKNSLKKQWANRALQAAGFLGFAGCFLVFGLLGCRHTAVHANESSQRTIAPVASVLSETEAQGEYCYLMGTGSDQNLAILQSLMPERPVWQEKNDGKERALFYEEVNQGDRDADVIITGTGDSLIRETMPKELPQYRLLFLTSSYALWAERGSEMEASLEQTVSQRLQYLELRGIKEIEPELVSDAEVAVENAEAEEELLPGEEQTEEALPEEETEIQSEAETELSSEEETEAGGSAEELEEETELSSENESETEEEIETETETEETLAEHRETYGGSSYLAPGTYRMEIYFKKTDASTGLSGQIRLKDSEGTILSQKVNDGIFGEGDTGAAVVEFTDREVMRKLRVIIDGTFAGHTEVTDIYYWKTSSAYTVGLNGTNAADAPCEAILEVEALCEEKGTVAYVGDVMTDASDLSTARFESALPGYTVEVLSKEEAEDAEVTYLIGPTASHSYYYAMENYTVIEKTRFYTVLVRNDSQAYEKFEENGGVLLSEGKTLTSQAFTEEESAEGPITLDEGSYLFHGRIRGYAEDGVVVQLRDGEEVIAELEARESTFELPFALNKRRTQLSCTAENEEGEELEVTDWGIELTSEKYQFGQEEEELSELFAVIKDLGAGVTVTPLQELDKLQEEDVQYDYLQEQLPDDRIEVRTYAEANAAVDDPLLLTYGLSEDCLRLAGKYCILGHAGAYTLWARCEGENVQKAMENGVEILSSAKKISPASLMAMTGTENETDAIAELPEAAYNLYLEVDVSELESDDTVEFLLLCDKTEEEIEDEITELMDAGYTRKEAEKKVDEQMVCGSATYQAYDLEAEQEMVYTIQTTESRQFENLEVEAYTWDADTVECEVVWIEIA